MRNWTFYTRPNDKWQLLFLIIVIILLVCCFAYSTCHAQPIADTTTRIIDESPDSIVVERTIMSYRFCKWSDKGWIDYYDCGKPQRFYKVGLYEPLTTTIDTVIYDRRLDSICHHGSYKHDWLNHRPSHKPESDAQLMSELIDDVWPPDTTGAILKPDTVICVSPMQHKYICVAQKAKSDTQPSAMICVPMEEDAINSPQFYSDSVICRDSIITRTESGDSWFRCWNETIQICDTVSVICPHCKLKIVDGRDFHKSEEVNNTIPKEK